MGGPQRSVYQATFARRRLLSTSHKPRWGAEGSQVRSACPADHVTILDVPAETLRRAALFQGTKVSSNVEAHCSYVPRTGATQLVHVESRLLHHLVSFPRALSFEGFEATSRI